MPPWRPMPRRVQYGRLRRRRALRAFSRLLVFLWIVLLFVHMLDKMA